MDSAPRRPCWTCAALAFIVRARTHCFSTLVNLFFLESPPICLLSLLSLPLCPHDGHRRAASPEPTHTISKRYRSLSALSCAKEHKLSTTQLVCRTSAMAGSHCITQHTPPRWRQVKLLQLHMHMQPGEQKHQIRAKPTFAGSSSNRPPPDGGCEHRTRTRRSCCANGTKLSITTPPLTSIKIRVCVSDTLEWC